MENVTINELILLGIINTVVAIFSGIAGAGGGFVITPLLIFFGLSPASAVATGKLSGLAVAVGSLGGLRGIKSTSKKRLAIIIVLALAIGLAAPYAIVRLDNQVYRQLLGGILLVMIPVLIIKKVGHAEQHPTLLKKLTGYSLLILSLSLQAVFSGGLGTLVIIVLMAFLGMSALEANVTKRYSQVTLNVVIVLGLLGSGLIVWPVALVGMASAGLGGFIGGKIAAKKSNRFVMAVFIALLLISAIELLFG